MLESKLVNTWAKERKMLNFQRLAGTTKLRSYNLAEHSYFVGLMFQELAEKYNVNYSKEDLIKIFRHDFMEVFTTDLPWTVKHCSKEVEFAWDVIETVVANKISDEYNYVVTDNDLKKLSKECFALFKYCDAIELLQFCVEECEIGNASPSIQTVIKNCKKITDAKELQVYSFSEDLNDYVENLVEIFTDFEYN